MSGALAGRCRAIVTARTGTRNTRVIKVHRSPVGGDMTVLTAIGRLEMRRALAGRCRAVMTT